MAGIYIWDEDLWQHGGVGGGCIVVGADIPLPGSCGSGNLVKSIRGAKYL